MSFMPTTLARRASDATVTPARVAVQTTKRLFTFDTLEDADRFVASEDQAGHVVICIYNPALIGPVVNEFTCCAPANEHKGAGENP